MNLPELLDPRKEWGRALYLIFVLLLIGIGSFFLGRLSVGISSHTGFNLVGESISASALHFENAAPADGAIAGGIVASKTGSKYHFPWCAGAQSIRPENKIWFANTEEARAAGYAPASNCKGLE